MVALSLVIIVIGVLGFLKIVDLIKDNNYEIAKREEEMEEYQRNYGIKT